MNEGTIWIIVGLFFDMCGAFLIVRPLLNFIAFKKLVLKEEDFPTWRDFWSRPVAPMKSEKQEKKGKKKRILSAIPGKWKENFDDKEKKS